MNESFQEQKREQLPQAEAPIQDRKEKKMKIVDTYGLIQLMILGKPL